MIHAEERNRFERIVARRPYLAVLLASATGVAVGSYVTTKLKDFHLLLSEPR